MSSSQIRGLQATLVVMSCLAIYCTWGLMAKNGSLEMLDGIREQTPPLVPGTEALLKIKYTRIGPLDHLLTTLTIFFYQAVDGSSPHTSLQSFHFGGQVFAIWGLLLLEGIRKGNQGKLISYDVAFGLLSQATGFTIWMPLWVALYLSTSPLVRPTAANISTHIGSTTAIPISLALGYFIPSILMSLPAPSMIDFETKQSLIALWQPFPVWVAILQQIFGRTFGSSGYTAKENSGSTLNTLRPVYLSLVIFAAYTHAETFTIIMISTLFPSLFASGYVGVFNFSKVFLPEDLTGSARVQNVGSSLHEFLKYDEIIGSTAVILWVAFLYVQADSRRKAFGKWPQLVLAIGSLTVLAGPGGCAVALMWARDELVLSRGSSEQKRLH